MLTAKEARRAVGATEKTKAFAVVEAAVRAAIDVGLFDTDAIDVEFLDPILDELEELGYRVEYYKYGSQGVVHFGDDDE